MTVLIEDWGAFFLSSIKLSFVFISRFEQLQSVIHLRSFLESVARTDILVVLSYIRSRLVEYPLFVLIRLDAARLVHVWFRNVSSHSSIRLSMFLLITYSRDRVLTLSKRLSIVVVMEI